MYIHTIYLHNIYYKCSTYYVAPSICISLSPCQCSLNCYSVSDSLLTVLTFTRWLWLFTTVESVTPYYRSASDSFSPFCQWLFTIGAHASMTLYYSFVRDSSQCTEGGGVGLWLPLVNTGAQHEMMTVCVFMYLPGNMCLIPINLLWTCIHTVGYLI